MKTKSGRFFGYLVAAVVGMAVYAGASNLSHRIAKANIGGKNADSIRQIAYRVCYYANESEGRLPETWSQLIAEHERDAHLFFFSGGGSRGGFQPPDHIARIDIVDETSIYRLSVIDENRAVVYDQPGIWPKIGVSWVMVVREDDEWKTGESGYQDTGEFLRIIVEEGR